MRVGIRADTPSDSSHQGRGGGPGLHLGQLTASASGWRRRTCEQRLRRRRDAGDSTRARHGGLSRASSTRDLSTATPEFSLARGTGREYVRDRGKASPANPERSSGNGSARLTFDTVARHHTGGPRDRGFPQRSPPAPRVPSMRPTSTLPPVAGGYIVATVHGAFRTRPAPHEFILKENGMRLLPAFRSSWLLGAASGLILVLLPRAGADECPTHTITWQHEETCEGGSPGPHHGCPPSS
jgi:hypothetical protein